MSNKKINENTNIITAVSFLVMIIVNALANILPINGVTTGRASEMYENLFAPAGITFAIWGVIYLLLACYTLYQLGLFHSKYETSDKTKLLKKVGMFFSASSIANTLWIFFWHYDFIPFSMVMIVVILICLIVITIEINKYKLSLREKLFIKLPFSVYFAWITIATIANTTTWLVSINWNGFGIPQVAWAVIIIIVGLIISGFTMIKNRDIAYGLVIIWAYLGIYIKHTSLNGFANQYPSVIITVIISIILLVVAEFYNVFLNRKIK